MPNTACSSPRSDFYNSFNGITIGVGGFMVWMCLLWAVGRAILRFQRWSPDQVTKFDRITISRIVLFLTMTCTPPRFPSAKPKLTLPTDAPVTEVVLSVFSCRQIGDAKYLREDPQKQCYVGDNNRYRQVGGFWIFFYVIGTPAIYYSLMKYYNIPKVARELKHNAQLRAVIDQGHRVGIHPPTEGFHYHSATLENTPGAYVDALWLGIVARNKVSSQRRDGGVTPRSSAVLELAKVEVRSEEKAAAAAPESPLAIIYRRLFEKGRGVFSADAAEPTREEKLRQLVSYSKEHLRCGVVTWHAAEGDPRLEGAEEAISGLYEEFYADKWYWILVEVTNKLIITGVLGFIAPGTQAQVAAAVGITFIMLLMYQRSLPYAEKVRRRCGRAGVENMPSRTCPRRKHAPAAAASSDSQHTDVPGDWLLSQHPIVHLYAVRFDAQGGSQGGARQR